MARKTESKTKYSPGEIGRLRIIEDFLPPEELVARDSKPYRQERAKRPRSVRRI
jgi:hypothetical protein